MCECYSFRPNNSLRLASETSCELSSEIEFSRAFLEHSSLCNFEENKQKLGSTKDLSMTSSQIDFSLEPFIKEKSISGDQLDYAVIASKGIWGVMTKEEVGQVIYSNTGKNEQQIANIIAEHAIKKWETSKKKAEDVTLILFNFH